MMTMKLAQFYDGKDLRVGIVRDGLLTPVHFEGDMQRLIEKAVSPFPTDQSMELKNVKLAAPVSRPSKIIALGLNYEDHAEESKGKIPEAPLIFAKFPNSLIGPRDEIVWNENVTKKVDYEAELAVVIGKKARKCSEEEAASAVFGYTCANDVSARDLQFGDGQWVRGKSLDTFCPLGPWIAAADEIPDPHDLKIRCVLNGRVMQDSHTGNMIFKIPFLIAFLSNHFTLYPGDVVLTGTPQGVGAFREPSVYMKHGDEVIVEIEKIGRLVNVCRTGSLDPDIP